MRKEDLIKVWEATYTAYEAECKKNGGREGSTESFRLRSLLDFMQWIFKCYYSYEISYVRFI